MQIKIFLLLSYILFLSLDCNSYWKKERLKTYSDMEWHERYVFPIGIGDGRGDGKNRIYSVEYFKYGVYSNLDNPYSKLLEYEWDNKKNTWDETIVFDYGINNERLEENAVISMSIGDARNDSKNRIYITFYIGKTAYFREYEWFGSSYSYIDMPSIDIQYSSELKIENARNDRKKRLYAFPYEFEWTGSSWNALMVERKRNDVYLSIPNGWFNSLEICEARDDGVKRIYVLGAEGVTSSPYTFYALKKNSVGLPAINYITAQILEYTWDKTASIWVCNTLLEKRHNIYTPESYKTNVGRMKIGKLKPDNKHRIYYIISVIYTGKFEKVIEEMEWVNNKWETNEIYKDNSVFGWADSAFVFYLGDIKNSGKNKLYIDQRGKWFGSKTGKFYELEYDGNKWTNQIIEYEDMMGFVVGKAKGDGKNRIYAAPGYEMEYNPDYFEKVKTEKLIPINNYFNPETGGKCSIICRVENSGDMSLKIYTLTGELVKTFIEGNKGNGEYIFSWDGKNNNGKIVGSGIYLAHLEGPGISETKKIGVIK